MPELPEVETIRRQLAPIVQGRLLHDVEVLDARWCRPLLPAELSGAIAGRRVLELARRGKYLVWHLDGDVHLAQHLRMTGTVLADPQPEPAHTRVRVVLSGARAARRRLVFVDPRRFGTGELLIGAGAERAFFDARLGPEPLQAAFDDSYLAAATRGRSAPIKAFLLDQRRIAGVGNIYADEALYKARIHPRRAAGRLTAAQRGVLREAVIEALLDGIDARGATIDDFRHVDGVSGAFQDRFLVYGRAGEPCARCGTPIAKTVVAGRGTYVCETCQPPPRGSRARSVSQGPGASKRGRSAGASR